MLFVTQSHGVSASAGEGFCNFTIFRRRHYETYSHRSPCALSSITSLILLSVHLSGAAATEPFLDEDLMCFPPDSSVEDTDPERLIVMIDERNVKIKGDLIVKCGAHSI